MVRRSGSIPDTATSGPSGFAGKARMTKRYLVTVHDVGNITDRAENVHTILTSTDHIEPRGRVEVVEVNENQGLVRVRWGEGS